MYMNCMPNVLNSHATSSYFTPKNLQRTFSFNFCAHISNVKEGRDRPYDNNLFFIPIEMPTHHIDPKRWMAKTPYVIICYLYVHEMQSLKIIFPEEWKTNIHTRSHIMHSSFTQICSDMFNCGVYMRRRVWCGIILTARKSNCFGIIFCCCFFHFIVFSDCEHRERVSGALQAETVWIATESISWTIPSSYTTTHFV